jgi:hypothetical protein
MNRRFLMLINVLLLALPAALYASGTIPVKSKQSASTVEKSEVSVLRADSFFGDFRSPRIVKEFGNIRLEVWKPYVEHIESRLSQFRNVLITQPQELHVEYDEIWIDQTVNKHVLYWKNGEVQAATGEKEYVSNPVTGESINPPAFKIIMIHNRFQILKELRMI